MSQSVINLDSIDANFNQDVELSGNLYKLKFRWNVRGEFWTCGIADAQGNDLVSGQKIVADYFLFHRFVDDRLPQGLISTLDMTGTGIVTRDGLGTNLILLYEDDL